MSAARRLPPPSSSRCRSAPLRPGSTVGSTGPTVLLTSEPTMKGNPTEGLFLLLCPGSGPERLVVRTDRSRQMGRSREVVVDGRGHRPALRYRPDDEGL